MQWIVDGSRRNQIKSQWPEILYEFATFTHPTSVKGVSKKGKPISIETEIAKSFMLVADRATDMFENQVAWKFHIDGVIDLRCYHDNNNF